jgi:hypothetical protein
MCIAQEMVRTLALLPIILDGCNLCSRVKLHIFEVGAYPGKQRVVDFVLTVF